MKFHIVAVRVKWVGWMDGYIYNKNIIIIMSIGHSPDVELCSYAYL